MDLVTLALAKKFANKVAAGFSKVEVSGMKITFTLNDGTTTSLTVPAPADGKDGNSIVNIDINENGELVCTLSDNTIIVAGNIANLLPDYYETTLNELQEENKRLRNDIESIALTKIYEGENITIEDASNARFKSFEMYGNINQNMYEGYNAFNINNREYIFPSGAGYTVISDNSFSMSGMSS